MNVDAVVLDIDGVLVDVSGSYRRAIVESVERVHGERPSRETVQLLKEAGGFNDDWELTSALALYLLARREGFDRTPEEFAAVVEASGGGLEAARAAVADALPPDGRERVLAAWDRDGSMRAGWCSPATRSTTSGRHTTPVIAIPTGATAGWAFSPAASAATRAAGSSRPPGPTPSSTT